MKYYLGIDTGTTSISIAAINESHHLITSRTVNHSAFITGESEASRIQNPEKIIDLVTKTLDEIISELGQPSAIGFTGQMHGIIYVDESGKSVSPLYTWQDSTGDSSIEILKNYGLHVSSGYGMATHFYLQRENKIPSNAHKLTTISDYVAMRLCGNSEPVLSSEMAASWGCFDLHKREFMTQKLINAGVDVSFLPRVVNGYEIIGKTKYGVPVVCSMGDNQASFRGSVKNPESSLLLNVGTGSQVSMMTDKYYDVTGNIELRPYGEKFLLVGASLCGGRAYAMLEKFYREISGREYYSIMMNQAQDFINQHGLNEAWNVNTTFMGTRSDPSIRGSISGISETNFCAGALTAGVIRGILYELLGFYEGMIKLTGKNAHEIVGSGNGLRKNELMQKLAEQIFSMNVNIPDCTEEAASGAALCGASFV